MADKSKGRADRFDDFVKYLEDHPAGARVTDIAAYLGVDRRSVYRYIDRAAELGIEQYDSVYRLPSQDRERKNRTIQLSNEEIQILRIALQDIEPLSPVIRRVLTKIRNVQNEREQRQFTYQKISFVSYQDQLIDGLTDQVFTAILKRTTLEIKYQNSKGEENTYHFDPYGLWRKNDHLYLIGQNHWAREKGYSDPSHLRMDAIQKAIKTQKNFIVSDFDIQAYVNQHFGVFGDSGPPMPVVCWVHPDKAHAVKRTQRHPSQICEEQDDGSLIYCLEVPISRDLVKWVVGYGGGVKVISPPKLREQVLVYARGVLEAHEEIGN